MDNKKWYGEEIFKYSIRQGINEGYLCDYQILTLFTENKFIQDYIEQNKLIETIDIKNIDSYYLATSIMIIKSFEDHNCNHQITYHNSIANSIKLMNILNTLISKLKLDINILQLDGKMSIYKRNKIISTFKNYNECILVTAKVLNEGINIPIIDSVCFVDQRESTIDITQCIGRALRPYKNKTLAKILVPYFFEDINQLSNDLYFPKLINIIKGLSESDESIKEYLTIRNSGKQYNKKIIKFENYLSNESMIFISNKINLDDWINNIEINLWKKMNHFEYNYNILKEWVNINKKIPSINSKNKIEKTLGRYCVKLRQNCKNGILNEEKIEKLNLIEGWYWSSNIKIKFQTFEEKFYDIKNWVIVNNKIPSDYSKNEEESRLGRLCNKLRANYKKNKLNKNQIQLLEKIPNWFWESKASKKTFDENFNDLRNWLLLNKRMPSRYTNDISEKKLGEWSERQKILKRKNKMSIDIILKFNQLEYWIWNIYKKN